MNIHLNVIADKPPLTRLEFENNAPPYSIAIDGYVIGAPWYDPKKKHRNFNHHEDVDRLSTRSTADQINMALHQGLYDAFQIDGVPTATLWVGDCDEDVCTSVTQLRNPHIIKYPSFNLLLDVVDKFDTTSGAFPMLKNSHILEETSWVFQPYRNFRNSGGLARRKSSEFKSVIDEVEGRILLYSVGRGKEIPIDTRYEHMGGGKGWAMVKEIGAQSRLGMFSDGMRAFISVRDTTVGRFDYVIGKCSEYYPFPVEEIFIRLNQEEHLTGNDIWGPCTEGTIIGGSPRVQGSRLNPDQVTHIVEEVLRNKKY